MGLPPLITRIKIIFLEITILWLYFLKRSPSFHNSSGENLKCRTSVPVRTEWDRGSLSELFLYYSWFSLKKRDFLEVELQPIGQLEKIFYYFITSLKTEVLRLKKKKSGKRTCKIFQIKIFLTVETRSNGVQTLFPCTYLDFTSSQVSVSSLHQLVDVITLKTQDQNHISWVEWVESVQDKPQGWPRKVFCLVLVTTLWRESVSAGNPGKKMSRRVWKI